MDVIAAKLDEKLRQWRPDTAEQVRQQVAEIMQWADSNAVDVARSRRVEQEVLDLIDAPQAQ
ncbi:MAG TPA: hypothetical protein VFE46_12865 [Pirellulales bacterium]|jgi:hypothetical protein|nr:hypothetical protein [Pirellulales bacterium]